MKQIREKRNILLKIEYLGTSFAGWQRQKNERTVQGVIEDCLKRFLRHEIKLIGAGRTDSGVHALAQHANFVTVNPMKVAEIKYRLNRLLPKDIVVLASREMPIIFNARRHALWRSYHYLISERASALKTDFSWILARQLDLSSLKKMTELITQSEDFSNFCKTKSQKTDNRCQIINANWTHFGGFLKFNISANRFLHNMVRLLVGTMMAVSDGLLTIDDFEEMLKAKTDKKTKYIAPACGLYLTGVKYERTDL